MWTSATWPGVYGLIAMPASRNPMIGGSRSRMRDQPADQAERQRERQLVHQAQGLVGVRDLLDDLVPNVLNP